MNFKNSNLFPTSLAIPKAIKHSAQILQLFSTNLTAIIGTKLFKIPIKLATPKREKAMQNSAQHKSIFVKNIQKNIHVLSYGYSKKKVLLVHGWAGRSTQLFMFADRLLEKGYMVISFDGPSHGKSDGKTTLMPEFIETIKELDNNFGPFDAAIGHSLGGMCLFNSAVDDLSFKSFVSIGATDKISTVMSNFTNNLGVKPIVAKKMKNIYDKKFQIDIDSFSPVIKAKKIKIPALVIHDSNDGDVCVSNAIKIRQNLKYGQLLITSGLGHTKILRNKNLVYKTVDFILKHS